MSYATLIEERRAQRASLLGFIESMEAGTHSVASPATFPKVNEATENYIHYLRRSVAELDFVIAAYEANPDA